MFDRVSSTADPADREQAFKELLIAEGSDWFWWYGDDHSSEHDLEFDELFRRHIRNVYQMLGQQVPEELFATNISTGHVPLTVVTPVGLLNPVLDGRASSYFEWLPAGIVETDAPSGTMTGGERHEPAVKRLLFGFDLENLYLRLDLAGPAGQKLAEGTRCSVNFTTPADWRLVLFGTGRGPVAELHHRTRAAPGPRSGDGISESRGGRHPRSGRCRSPTWACAQQPLRLLRVHPERRARARTSPRTSPGRKLRPRTRFREAELESLGTRARSEVG